MQNKQKQNTGVSRTKVRFTLSKDTELNKLKNDINVVDGVSRIIVEEIEDKLNEIFNHRKHDEGLVSIHNDMLFDLHRTIIDWHKKNIESAKHLEKMDERLFRDEEKRRDFKQSELFKVKDKQQ